MCIYCSTKNYRKIYEQHYGPIPREDDGRTYDIHHIDGDRSNNHPSNLVALSIQDHYNIHLSQGDMYACWKIAIKMKKTPEEISEIARLEAARRIAEGTHHFKDSEWQRQNQQKIKENGNSFFVNDNPAKKEENKRYGEENVSKRPEVREKLSGDNHYMRSESYDKDTHNSKNPETIKKRSGKNHWASKQNPNYSPDKTPSFNKTIYKFVNEALGIVENTTFYDLRTRYKLDTGNLSRLVNGLKTSYRGWKIN